MDHNYDQSISTETVTHLSTCLLFSIHYIMQKKLANNMYEKDKMKQSTKYPSQKAQP